MPTIIQFLKLLKRRAFAAVCIVLTVGLLVAYFMRLDLLDDTRNKIDTLQKEAGNMKRNLRNAVGLQEQLADLKVLLSIVDARLVRPEELASNLQYFYRLESATGVKILLLRQISAPTPSGASGGSPSSKPSYGPVSYSVIVEGSFPQVMSFLTQLERGPHFNRTLSFTAQRGATDSPTGIRTGTVVVNLNVELLGLK